MKTVQVTDRVHTKLRKGSCGVVHFDILKIQKSEDDF